MVISLHYIIGSFTYTVRTEYVFILGEVRCTYCVSIGYCQRKVYGYKKSTDKGAGKNRNTISNINCNMGKITLQSQKCAKLGHGYATIKRREIQLEKKNVKLDKNNCDFRKNRYHRKKC